MHNEAAAMAADDKRDGFFERLNDIAAAASESAPASGYRTYFGWRGKRLNVVEEIEKGITIKSATGLAKHFDIEPTKFFITYINISRATLNRRKAAKSRRFNAEESDRLVRFARLLSQATEMMGDDEEAARGWLSTPLPALGDRTPLEMAMTEAGARRVEDLIVSLKYGMFS